jgi:hypothetical protein
VYDVLYVNYLVGAPKHQFVEGNVGGVEMHEKASAADSKELTS